MKTAKKTKRFRPLKLPRVRPEEITVVTGLDPPFLKLSVACRYGGFGKTHAYELIRTGRIKAVKLGKHTMIEVASIDRFHATLPKLINAEACA